MQAADPSDKLLANKILSSPANLIRIGAKPLIACARIERQFQDAWKAVYCGRGDEQGRREAMKRKLL
jgi:hypothetical protein